MELIVKTGIIVVILIVGIFAFYYLQTTGAFGSGQISKADATTLVYHDLQNSFQNSIINITNVTPSEYAGSWHITAAVVQNATSPCPDYSIYSFDYPKYNFVYKTENTYTQNCVVYENGVNQSSIIGSYPAAITKSYDMNITIVKNLIYKYGFYNVTVHASYLKSLNNAGKTYSDVWIINYTAPTANISAYVLMYESNGTLIKSYS